MDSNIINQLVPEGNFTHLCTDFRDYLLCFDIETTKSIFTKINPNWQKKGLKIIEDFGWIPATKKQVAEYDTYINEVIEEAAKNNIHFTEQDLKYELYYFKAENNSTIRLMAKYRITKLKPNEYRIAVLHNYKMYIFTRTAKELIFHKNIQCELIF